MKEPGSSAPDQCVFRFGDVRASLISTPLLLLFFGNFFRVLFPAASAPGLFAAVCIFVPVEDERVAKNSNPAPLSLPYASKTLLIRAQSSGRFSDISLHIVRLRLLSFFSTVLSTVVMRITTIIFMNNRHIHPDRVT